MKKALLFCILLSSVTAIGAVNFNMYTPYLSVLAVFVITLLVVTRKLDPSTYPVYLYGLALSLLWQTSMLGTYIVGTDIHGELTSANWVIDNGIHKFIPGGNGQAFGTVLLVPAINSIFGISAIWQFKATIPAFFALTPVLLYYLYIRYFGSIRAYLATIFIVMMPMFVLDMTSHTKGMLAQPFFVATFLVLVLDIGFYRKLLLSSICVIFVAINHYMVAAWLLIYLSSLLGLLVLVKLFLHRVEFKTLFTILLLIVICVTSFYFWDNQFYYNKIDTFIASAKNVFWATTETVKSGGEGISSDSVDPRVDLYLTRTEPINSTGTYLDKQDQMVRAALGLDFMEASSLGKLFRLTQMFIQFLFFLGAFYLLRRWCLSKTNAIYLMLLVSSFLVMLCVIFVPFFSTYGSVTRIYQIALYFMAPSLVFGFEYFVRIIELCKNQVKVRLLH